MNHDDGKAVDDTLRRFGLPAAPADRAAIIELLEEQIRLEAEERDDQDLLRLLCVQLFSLGLVEDCLLIWRAKSCNFDTHCGIDVQFLCGAGLDVTKQYLVGVNSDAARKALYYLVQCESVGDFEAFSPATALEQAREFYIDM